MIRKVFSLNTPFHLLIVEDNSPDRTTAIVKNCKRIPDTCTFLKERKMD